LPRSTAPWTRPDRFGTSAITLCAAGPRSRA
jgi:hypothetical protein